MGTNTHDWGSGRFVGGEEPTRDDHLATKKYVDDHGGGSPVDVTDGVTTVTGLTELDFTSGATVTDAGGGVAQVAVEGGGGVVPFVGVNPPGSPTDGMLWWDPDDNTAVGGSQPGTVRVLKFPFDSTMAAALDAGASVFTPSVGDYLLDAWIETDDPTDVWVADGDVLPNADIGIVSAGAFVPGGLWTVFVGPPVDLSDFTWETSNGKIAYIGSSAHAKSDLLGGAMLSGNAPPLVRFLTTDPLKLVVSGDGSVGGGAFDGSAGASTLYIKVCTPGDAS